MIVLIPSGRTAPIIDIHHLGDCFMKEVAIARISPRNLSDLELGKYGRDAEMVVVLTSVSPMVIRRWY